MGANSVISSSDWPEKTAFQGGKLPKLHDYEISRLRRLRINGPGLVAAWVDRGTTRAGSFGWGWGKRTRRRTSCYTPGATLTSARGEFPMSQILRSDRTRRMVRTSLALAATLFPLPV